MRTIRDRLYVAGDEACPDAKGSPSDGERVVVHACKAPCHQTAVGYTGTLPHDHDHYLALEAGRHLYLNLIDPPQPLFKMESFERFFRFVRRHWTDGRDLLIHCNKGQSRSPSLALLVLAGVTGDIPDDTFVDAATAYVDLDPAYRPGRGIETYLRREWDALMDAAQQ